MGIVSITLTYLISTRYICIHIFTYYMSSPTVSCLQSAPAKSGKRYNIELAKKRRKTAAVSFPPVRSQNRTRRKELLHNAKWHISRRGACQRDGSARIVLAVCILAMVHRSHRRRERTGRFSSVNCDDLGRRRERRNGDLVLMENRFQLCGVHVSRRRRRHSARASEPDAG